MVAWGLSSLEGAPEFRPDWPDAEKDSIILKIAEFLRQHEQQLRAFPATLQDAGCFPESVYLEK
jgi:hypothetical protein